ncbi:hypothetical protein CLOHAE12215_00102 [Clostridium haemolyticum]|uniref:BhlA/UviB family holin-like peptide n=1 Tax=Clostridium haemolyticum TaxID=84025 RepID=UPI0009CFE54C|nr:BhlA/UviB family holin-like peptide [Clostridium haemolyticum]OOB76495.1 hypothetical protein AXF41_12025 [Clostridium haemolyticum]CAG7838755.1 hypothetical protein CLOHAE12215_00102 [Clostridium haemolyticum]
MEQEILKLASSQGIWAVLAIILIFYILKAQAKRDLKQELREENYQSIIAKLTEKFSIFENIERNVKKIKNYVFKNDT